MQIGKTYFFKNGDARKSFINRTDNNQKIARFLTAPFIVEEMRNNSVTRINVDGKLVDIDNTGVSYILVPSEYDLFDEIVDPKQIWQEGVKYKLRVKSKSGFLKSDEYNKDLFDEIKFEHFEVSVNGKYVYVIRNGIADNNLCLYVDERKFFIEVSDKVKESKPKPEPVEVTADDLYESIKKLIAAGIYFDINVNYVTTEIKSVERMKKAIDAQIKSVIKSTKSKINVLNRSIDSSNKELQTEKSKLQELE
ncbi:hypothetical protein POP12_099 [Pectobacterium phage POP12]|nr:hypothetical protein POP12_099 [Pectobacterium phage POP12]